MEQELPQSRCKGRKERSEGARGDSGGRGAASGERRSSAAQRARASRAAPAPSAAATRHSAHTTLVILLPPASTAARRTVATRPMHTYASTVNFDVSTHKIEQFEHATRWAERRLARCEFYATYSNNRCRDQYKQRTRFPCQNYLESKGSIGTVRDISLLV